MNAAHVHLVLNHLPIAGIGFAIPLLLLGWMLGREDFSRAGFLLVVLAGIATIPVFLSGESAADVVKRLPGVSEAVIERHEDAAGFTIGAVGATAIVAAVGLAGKFLKKNLLRIFLPVTLLLCVVSTVALAWTNNLGGQIQHSEIRSKGAPGQPPANNDRKHDDD